MLWKTSKGNFLLQWEIAPLPFIAGGLNHPGTGERFDKATTYYEVTSSGNVIKKYGQPRAVILEDKVAVSAIHRVSGDTLYHFYWSQASGHEAEIQIDRRLLKLRPYEGTLPFDPATVITAYEQAMIQSAQDREWEPLPVSRTVYEGGGSLMPHTTLAPFMAVLGPLLRVYGFRGAWHGSLGGPQGARLEYSECERYSDGYSALGGYQRIRGFQLAHSVTGEKLDMSMEIDLLNYSSDVIRLRFEGAAGEVEKFRAAVRPVLEEFMQR